MTLLESQLARLRGQTAWITGGRRIGRTVARTLAEQGVNIVAGYRRSQGAARRIVADCEALGVSALAVQADAASRESFRRAVARVRRRFPEIHILVNMASVYRPAAVQSVTAQHWRENVGAHILGTFWPVQALAPYMPPGSHIINVADACVTGRVRKRVLPYQVTKAAVAAMTRALAAEYADRGLFVNAIAPGPILPPEGFPPETWRAIREKAPLKHPINDQEAVEQFALLVLYLSLTTAATGHVFPLDLGENL